MAEKEIFQKMIDEAMAAQRADIEVIKEKRGGEFVISDALPYVNAVKGMKAGPGQSPEVISLHVDSVVAHFEILRDLTKTIRPEDDPYVEHYQTPPVYEILLEEDPNFKEAVDKFIDQLKKERALIQREAIRRYGGWYGPIDPAENGHRSNLQADHTRCKVLGYAYLIRVRRRLHRRHQSWKNC